MFSTIEFINTIIGLLLVTTLTLTISKRLALPIPVTLVGLGIILNQFALPSQFLTGLVTHPEFPQVITFIFLPTLIFEAAMKWEVRPLRFTLLPIALLAIIGFLGFTLIVGLLIKLTTPLTLPESLLFGVLLSPTDPRLTVTWFKSLSAPKRLFILLEGESLCHHALAMVAAKILFSLVIIDTYPLATLWQEWEGFLWQLGGGLLIGWSTTLLLGGILTRRERNTFIEISLTLILVYGNFLLAEEWLQVSGVMATLATGLTLSQFFNSGFTLSTPYRLATTPTGTLNPDKYLSQVWEYLAQLTSALAFLLVGVSLPLPLLFDSLELVAIVMLALWLGRALIVYGFMSLLTLLPYQKHIGWRHRTVMYWGSLRGAAAVVILFSLGQFPQGNLFLTVVTVTILLTILVQEFTLTKVIRWLRLNQPSLIERFLRLEGLLTAQQRALERIPEFQQGGLFSARIAEQQALHCQHNINDTRHRLTTLREQVLDPELEQRLLFLRVFAAETVLYHDMFVKGHLSERAYRNLTYSIELQSESIRQEGQLPKFTLHYQTHAWWQQLFKLKQLFWQGLEYLPSGRRWSTQLQAWHTAKDYEQAWGRHQGNLYILSRLDDIAQPGVRPQTIEKIRSHYRRWHDSARARIDHTTEQFSEFVTAMQIQLAQRLVLHAEREALTEQANAGFLPTGIAQHLIKELDTQLQEQTANWYTIAAHLRLEPTQLLRNLPLFKQWSMDHCGPQIVPYLKFRTLKAQEILIKQGQLNDTLFLVVHGVIRVSRLENGQDKDVATLMAGDYVGEEALLGDRIYHTATYRTVPPCSVYELQRADFEKIRAACP